MKWIPVKPELINDVTDTLPALSYVGFYNLIYLAPPRDDVLCADCATRRFRNGESLVYGTYDEGPDLSCQDCGAAIQANYAENYEE